VWRLVVKEQWSRREQAIASHFGVRTDAEVELEGGRVGLVAVRDVEDRVRRRGRDLLEHGSSCGQGGVR
jgi:hypothetical protein